MNAVLLPVVHPSFEKLKLSGRWLHFSAAIFILSHALSHLRHHESSQLYIWCQFIISVDILALFFAGQRFISQMPVVSLFFRMVEVIFFTGIGIIMLLSANWLTGVVHILLGIAYCFLFYCERKLRNEELVFIHHTGITLAGITRKQIPSMVKY